MGPIKKGKEPSKKPTEGDATGKEPRNRSFVAAESSSSNGKGKETHSAGKTGTEKGRVSSARKSTGEEMKMTHERIKKRDEEITTEQKEMDEQVEWLDEEMKRMDDGQGAAVEAEPRERSQYPTIPLAKRVGDIDIFQGQKSPAPSTGATNAPLAEDTLRQAADKLHVLQNKAYEAYTETIARKVACFVMLRMKGMAPRGESTKPWTEKDSKYFEQVEEIIAGRELSGPWGPVPGHELRPSMGPLLYACRQNKALNWTASEDDSFMVWPLFAKNFCSDADVDRSIFTRSRRICKCILRMKCFYLGVWRRGPGQEQNRGQGKLMGERRHRKRKLEIEGRLSSNGWFMVLDRVSSRRKMISIPATQVLNVRVTSPLQPEICPKI